MSNRSKDNHPVYKRMTNAAFARRCEKLFGRMWVHEVAFNLNRSRQGIELIRDGRNRVSAELAIIIDAWEKGILPVRRRPPPVYGRPKKEPAKPPAA